MSAGDIFRGFAMIIILFFASVFLAIVYDNYMQDVTFSQKLDNVEVVKIYSNGEVNGYTSFNDVSYTHNSRSYRIDFDDRVIEIRGMISIENDSLIVYELNRFDTHWK